jgi:hypothetical protein
MFSGAKDGAQPGSYGSVREPRLAAYAACFSLRAAFRVCHDLLSVFGFGFSRFRDSRPPGVAVFATSASCQGERFIARCENQRSV